jgi:TolB-like protein
MFTDIVGYTQLMGDDEDKGFSVLNENRKIQHPIIQKFNGILHKELGDGILASFDTATNAVLCSKEIQDVCSRHSDFNLRIGIHLSEVVFEENDVFGNGVNIASRIQGKAPPGGIFITEPVYRNIQSRISFETEFVSQENLKNVKFPVRIYSIKTGIKPASLPDSIKKSIAVLPFVNMSGDQEQEYFCDGISEEIINTIVQFPDIKVAARTSSFSFKGKNEDLRIIGQKLGVNNVLEGSVRKSRNRIRINAQLLEASTGFHLWSKKYDRELNDIFEIQDEIALEIADQLMITLSDSKELPVRRNQTQNIDAYQFYLKGKSLYYQRGPSIKEAIDSFNQALDIDPDYALAYSGLADTYVMFGFWGIMAPEDCWPRAIEASRMASQIDENLSETCNSRAIKALLYDRDFDTAEREFKKAIKLNPTNTQARVWYGLFYLQPIRNEIEKGLKQCKLATEFDPLSAYAYLSYAWSLIYAGRINEAKKVAEYGVKLGADDVYIHNTLGYIYLLSDNLEDSLREFLICRELTSSSTHVLCQLISIYLKMDEKELAAQAYSDLEIMFQKQKTQPISVAMAAAMMGNNEYALEVAELAANVHDVAYPFNFLGFSEFSRPLVQLPGFKNILEKSGIPLHDRWHEIGLI